MRIILSLLLIACTLSGNAQGTGDWKEMPNSKARISVNRAIEDSDIVIEAVITSSSYDASTELFHATYRVVRTLKGDFPGAEIT